MSGIKKADVQEKLDKIEEEYAALLAKYIELRAKLAIVSQLLKEE